MMTFTPKAQQVLTDSKKLAKDSNHRFVSTEHLFLALINIKTCQAITALHNSGVDISRLKKSIVSALKTSATTLTDSETSFSPRAQKALQEAAIFVNKFKQSHIGTEHLLLGMLSQASQAISNAVNNQKCTVNDIRLQVLKLVKRDSEALSSIIDDYIDKPEKNKPTEDDDSKASMLSLFTRELTQLAVDQKLPITIGREFEIDRCVEVLMRYSKNNPVFIGEAGVGKTAIVEGLANRIVIGNVPDQLLSKKIFQLDIAMLVAGTRYRGDLEERIKKLLLELQADEDNILFIDEIHMIVGGSAGDSAIDIANILKPALSRGELTCIGATTIAEYRSYIEPDSALQRRFQTIMVDEPSKADTLKILAGIKSRFERHHNIKYTRTGLTNIVELAGRYITDRNFPDKAIDVMDEIGSRVRAASFNEIFETDIDYQINKLEKTKIQCIGRHDYDTANEIKQQQDLLLKKYDDLYTNWLRKQSKAIRIKEEHVLDYMSSVTGMPITRLQLKESNRLKRLNSYLSSKIIGQSKATDVMSAAIKRARVGVNDPDRPLCSFLFIGPTGVGKTHSAKVLSDYLFNNRNIIHINMSECNEAHSISKLIGSPPGYVGYNESGLLTEGIKRNPYAIILLDEVEKAHPDVVQILLQLLEEGTVTDSSGEDINFKNAIVVMTGNIGSSILENPGVVGFGGGASREEDVKEKINKELYKFFRPELVNRIDEVIVFRKLNTDDLVKISKLEFKKLISRLRSKNIKLTIDNDVAQFIVSKIRENNMGARPLRRAISQHIQDRVVDFIIDISSDTESNTSIHVSVKNNKINLELTDNNKILNTGI